MDGWVGGWVGGWVDRWMDAGAGLRIAYSNKKKSTQNLLFLVHLSWPI